MPGAINTFHSTLKLEHLYVSTISSRQRGGLDSDAASLFSHLNAHNNTTSIALAGLLMARPRGGGGALPRPLRGCSLLAKHGSINTHSAINFSLSVLIYPMVALGCFAMSNVLWRWAFHILYCSPLSGFFAPIDKKIVFTLLWNKKLRGRGDVGGGGTMKFKPFKTVSFSDNIAQGAGCLSAPLEKQRSPDW